MNKKTIIIIALVAVILLMAVGYAAFAQLLTINGTANITASWDIKISNISEGSMVGSSSKTPPSVSSDGLSATFDVDLKYPGATAAYTVTVQNAGTIDAILDSVDGIEAANSTNPTDISYSINASPSDVLSSNTTKDYVVTVTWNAETNSVPAAKSKTATITLNYLQNT